MATFQIRVDYENFGTYTARTAAMAIKCWKDESGYHATPDEDIEAVEIDENALIEAVQNETGVAVFQDPYGGGVALVNNKSYATLEDLAKSIGKELMDFRALTSYRIN
jgi:hypothetical protein